MSTVSTPVLANTLKSVLNKLLTDRSDGIEDYYSVYKKWCEVGKMSDAYHDDLPVYMQGLATEKPQGGVMEVGTMGEGPMTRYMARTFGLMLIMTRELTQDCKYDKAIDASVHLKRQMYRSIDTDATLMAMRAFNTSYVGGDGVCMCSASHPLPGGDTSSNVVSTPMSPSYAALRDIIYQAATLPGWDGYREGYQVRKIVHPVQQQIEWAAVLKSDMVPERGNYAEVNIIKKDYNISHVALPRWTSSSTSYLALTDAEDGIQFNFREKPFSSQWYNEGTMVRYYAIAARWARGWTNWRAVIGANNG